MVAPHALLLAVALSAQAAQPAAPQSAPGNARKAALLRDLCDKLEQSTAPFFGRGTMNELKKKLASSPRDAPPRALLPMLSALGDQCLNFGEIDEAIANYDRCVKIAGDAGDPRSVTYAKKRLAIAWMRAGERANCLTRHNADSCIFPLRGGALHVDKSGSEKAVELFQEVLASDGSDLQSIWLLNLASMTLGKWPDGVPPLWRIPASSFASERAMPRMMDVAPQLGLSKPSLAGSSIVDDFDGDGVLDIVTSSWAMHEPIRMFKRQADGTFAEQTGLGLEGQVAAFELLQFDANNDGRLDLMVQRGGWLSDFGRLPNSLLIQQPDGSFVDRTLEAGIEVSGPSQVAVAADIDLDGDLDLFLGYENIAGEQSVKYPCKLFRNRGDATFEDVTDAAGVVNGRACKGAAFGDYDGDGLPDLYVSNMNAPNRLYHNDGGCKFHDVAPELRVFDPFDSFATWFFDFDQDGWLDLWVGCYYSGDRSPQICAFYKNRTSGFDAQRLYHNDGHGGFKDVTVECRVDRVAFPMGCNFGDLDNDGFPDMYLSTGDPELASLWPNVLYHNGPASDGGRVFEDVTTATGTGHLQKGHGVSFADLDGDGDQDLFVKLGGANADDGFANVLFENPGFGNHWLTVRLIGRTSNRFGVGSRIRARIAEPSGERDVFHFVGTNSSFGGNSLQAEMGLGKATRIVALEVTWPASKKTQTFADVPLDRVVVVDEGSEQLTVLPPAPPRPLTAATNGSR